jgi:tetratricopeptide (TPR) repeat protein
VADRAKSREGDGSQQNIAAAEATPLPPEEREAALRAAIDATPAEPRAYSQLADFYTAQGRLQDAERLYRKALAVAGGSDLVLLEKLEDVYLLRMRERAVTAKRRAERAPSEAARKLVEQSLAESNQAEVEVFGARAARTPTDPRVQFEFALRLKRVGKHREAIEPLQAARGDSKRLAEVQLHLGECFQHIAQHRLAMKSYEAAIAALAPGEWTELRKLTLYRAGVLAMGMGEIDAAERHLTDLAAADFGYRDVSDRLDKLARIRDAT